MKLKFKETKKKGSGLQETFRCPVKDCLFYNISASAFYDHLKLVHQFFYFGDKDA